MNQRPAKHNPTLDDQGRRRCPRRTGRRRTRKGEACKCPRHREGKQDKPRRQLAGAPPTPGRTQTRAALWQVAVAVRRRTHRGAPANARVGNAVAAVHGALPIRPFAGASLTRRRCPLRCCCGGGCGSGGGVSLQITPLASRLFPSGRASPGPAWALGPALYCPHGHTSVMW